MTSLLAAWLAAAAAQTGLPDFEGQPWTAADGLAAVLGRVLADGSHACMRTHTPVPVTSPTELSSYDADGAALG